LQLLLKLLNEVIQKKCTVIGHFKECCENNKIKINRAGFHSFSDMVSVTRKFI